MCGSRGHGLVCVFPPDFHAVGRVVHHGVGCCAFAPAVAAHAGVRVVTGPRLHAHPCVLRGAAEPRVLLKRGGVGREPDVHALGARKGFRVVEPGEGREFGVVIVAVEIAFPACLQADGGRVERFQV